MKRNKNNLLRKKSQVTIFMIVAIVILVMGGVIFHYVSNSREIVANYDNDVNAIRYYIEKCLQDEAKKALYLMALQGGYYNIPEPYQFHNQLEGQNDSTFTAYYIKDSKYIIPGIEQIENELSLALKDAVDICTNNLSFFPYQIEVELSQISIKTNLNSDSLSFYIGLPITAKIGTSIHNLNEFNIELDSDFHKLYQVASNLTNNQFKNAKLLCLTCIVDYVNTSNVSIETVELEDENHYNIIYYLQSKDLQKNNPVFEFVHEITFSKVNITPKIEEIDELSADIGYKFSYQVETQGDNLMFSDDTDLFDINSTTGLINFIPDYQDSGSHVITVFVKDKYDRIADEVFTLKIGNFGYKPHINYIGYLDAVVNKPFSYQVHASSPENVEIFYIDNSELFNISLKTGLISFTPEPSQIGIYNFNITVINKKGDYDIQEGYLIVSD